MFVCLLLSACAFPSVQERVANGFALAGRHHWEPLRLKTDTGFDLIAFVPKEIEKTHILNIYIEGDGLAWRTRHKVSDNPTPVDPLVLMLAIQDENDAVYLARPCQYIDLKTQPACRPAYWSSHRFAPEIVDAMQAAIDSLKRRYGARSLRLIGYSGGGAVAALVAAGRDDVAALITIAGNLDTDAWTAYHDVTPLSGSLNPADYWQALQDIPQTHYIGSQDEIVPPVIAQSYAAHFPPDARPHLVIKENYDHRCCWQEMARF